MTHAPNAATGPAPPEGNITGGSGGSCRPSHPCQAGPGYHGPAGWGWPDGTAAFTG